MKLVKTFLIGMLSLLIALPAYAALDRKTKVSENDSTAGFLNGKLIPGNNISFQENNDGGNETLEIISTGGTGSPTILDLGNDAVDESADIARIATTGDTNAIFTEPSDDKLLIDLTKKWPSADTATTATSATSASTATALAANGSNCTAGSAAGGVDASGAAEDCTDYIEETELDTIAELNAQITDATLCQSDGTNCQDAILETELDTEAELEAQLTDVSNVFTNNDGALNDDDLTNNVISDLQDVTHTTVAANQLLIRNAGNTAYENKTMSGDATITAAGVIEVTQADALEVNGSNCSAGLAAGGVDASGVAEDCTDYITELELDTEAELEAQLTDVSNVFTNNDTIPVANGGTNLTASADDNVMVGNGTTWESKAIPSCSGATTDKLLYNTTTNTFSCGTDQDVAGSSEWTDLGAFLKPNTDGDGIRINNAADTSSLTVSVIGTQAEFDLIGSGATYRLNDLINCDTIDTDANGVLSCGTDASGAGGTPNILDLGNDAINESIDLVTFATTGDTNSIFTEPSADKLLIDVSKKWPTSNNADALSANGANCSAGLGAGGVDASGVAEDCTDYIEETELDTEAELEAQLTDVSNVFTNNDTIPVANGGTNLTASADDNVMVGNGTTWQSKAVPSCSGATTDKLLYNTTTNTFSCGTDQSGGSALGTNLTSTTDDIVSDNGTLLLGGTGNTNNENLDFDFETTANIVNVSSPSGADINTTSGVHLGIGLGTTVPLQPLVVAHASNTYLNVGSDVTATFQRSTSYARVAILSADNNYGEVLFAHPASAGAGGFRYDHTGSDKMTMRAGNADIFGITGQAHTQTYTFVSAPTISACGTSPTVAGNDIAGKITIGTGTTTSCTATFRTAFGNAPACIITGSDSAVTYAATTTTGALTVTSSADMDSDVIMYQCIEFVP